MLDALEVLFDALDVFRHWRFGLSVAAALALCWLAGGPIALPGVGSWVVVGVAVVLGFCWERSA